MSEQTTTATTSLDPRRWRALALLCVAYFMIIVDSQIVVLALPSIEAELAFARGGSQWVMSAYLLGFGGLLLFGGRTADLLGGRRMFMVGTALFLAASVLCGFAWSGGVLIAARVVQGVAAAIMAPTAMAVLMSTFPEGPERNRAIGVWTGLGAFGATAALLVGGSVTEGLGWEWIFFINVPPAGVVLLVGPRLLRETPIRPGRRSFDPLGAVTVTGALVLLAYAVVEAPTIGWGAPRTLGLVAGALLLFALFVVAERKAGAPLVPLRVFRLGSLVSGNVMTLLVAMTIYGGALMMSVYAQQVLGYSAVLFGLSTAVYAVASVVGSNLAGPLTTRFGYRKVAVLGALALTIGAWLLSRLTEQGGYWTDFLPAMVVFGYGIGTTVVAAAIAALAGVPSDESGLASGINNSVFQIGAAFGIAVSGTLSITDGRLVDGIRAGFTGAFVSAAVCLVIALALVTRRAPSRGGR
ncbi:MFS transporter [Actinosynnema sp. CS-041913]|uniref:MFS transporter n=1 Tax=Actinosynnema sp. CS-041913 TaxID=3239917 RepID=UPI003D8C815A